MSLYGLEAMPLRKQNAGGRAILRSTPGAIYDTECVKAATSTQQVIFFAKPQGQSDASGVITAKRVAETNLKAPSALPTPQSFELIGFNLKVVTNASGTLLLRSDYELMFLGCALTFFMGDRPFLNIPLWEIPHGTGTTGNTVVNADCFYTNGVPHRSNLYRFNIGKFVARIRPTENFSIQLNWTSAITTTNTVRLIMAMQGVLNNAV